MTFREKYRNTKDWHSKAMLMEIYHLAQITNNSKWTVTQTAKYFEVSIGLASENLKLAAASHIDASIAQIEHRQDALKRIR